MSILVHGFCAMSTHVHLVVTDPRGELPAFLEYFHRLLARSLSTGSATRARPLPRRSDHSDGAMLSASPFHQRS